MKSFLEVRKLTIMDQKELLKKYQTLKRLNINIKKFILIKNFQLTKLILVT